MRELVIYTEKSSAESFMALPIDLEKLFHEAIAAKLASRAPTKDFDHKLTLKIEVTFEKANE